MNKLREVLFPSEETKRKQKAIIDEIYKEAAKKKECIACKHYSYDATVPGFVTYEGDCDKGHVPFFNRDMWMVEECEDWILKEEGET